MFSYLPEVPVTKIRFSAPAPYKNPTVRSQEIDLVTRPKYPPYRETGVAIPL